MLQVFIISMAMFSCLTGKDDAIEKLVVTNLSVVKANYWWLINKIAIITDNEYQLIEIWWY